MYYIGFGITVRRRNRARATKTIQTTCTVWTSVAVRTGWWPTAVGTLRHGCSILRHNPLVDRCSSLLVRLVDDGCAGGPRGRVSQSAGLAAGLQLLWLRSGRRKPVGSGRCLGLLWCRSVVPRYWFCGLLGGFRFAGLWFVFI